MRSVLETLILFLSINHYLSKYKTSYQINTCLIYSTSCQESLKIPKGQSEALNRRKTENTTTMNNDKLMIYKTLTQKVKHRATRTPLKTKAEYRCTGRVSSSYSTCNTGHVTVKRHIAESLNSLAAWFIIILSSKNTTVYTHFNTFYI